MKVVENNNKPNNKKDIVIIVVSVLVAVIVVFSGISIHQNKVSAKVSQVEANYKKQQEKENTVDHKFTMKELQATYDKRLKENEKLTLESKSLNGSFTPSEEKSEKAAVKIKKMMSLMFDYDTSSGDFTFKDRATEAKKIFTDSSKDNVVDTLFNSPLGDYPVIKQDIQSSISNVEYTLENMENNQVKFAVEGVWKKTQLDTVAKKKVLYTGVFDAGLDEFSKFEFLGVSSKDID